MIHDFYCDVKIRSWGAVHRVFYDAMRTSGVGEFRAKLMYAAVLWGGPRWSLERLDEYQQASAAWLKDISDKNSGRLHYPVYPPDYYRHNPEEYADRFIHTYEITKRFPFSRDDLDALERELKKNDVVVEDVAALVDRLVSDRALVAVEVRRKPV